MKNRLPIIISLLWLCILLLEACYSRPSGESTSTDASKSTSPEKVVTAPPVSSKVKLYLENSGSMDGYIHDGNTRYKKALTQLLWGVDASFNSSNLNVSLINDQIFPKTFSGVLSFINQLDPKIPFWKVGNRSGTNLNVMLETILSEHQNNDVSIFLSDCIYSGENLSLQEENVRGLFNNKKKKLSDLTVVMVALHSDFKGKFYPPNGGVQVINNERPYYAIFIGKKGLVEKLMAEVKPTTLPGYGEMLVLTAKPSVASTYTASNLYASGSFSVEHRHELPEIEVNGNNPILFTIPATISKGLIPDAYLCDINNYKVEGGPFRVVKVIPYNEANAKAANSSAVVSLKFKVPAPNYVIHIQSLKPFGDGDLTVSLLYRKPTWVESYNSDDAANSSQSGKTYAIKYLINGLTSASLPDGEAVMTSFKINIHH
jgi:hypothetical protein